MRNLFALLLAITAISANSKDIDLGGVTFGMTSTELFKLAKSKRRTLEGPGKKLMAENIRIFVQDYVVSKDRQIVRVSGCKRQVIMLLKAKGADIKVIGVELWFKSKKNFQAYLKKLTKLGYEEVGDEYVGKLQEGDYVGATVNVSTDTLASGRKGRKKIYTIQARCFEVLGKGITKEMIIKAQGDGSRQ